MDYGHDKKEQLKKKKTLSKNIYSFIEEVKVIYILFNFFTCVEIYITKFTILTIFKCTLQ